MFMELRFSKIHNNVDHIVQARDGSFTVNKGGYYRSLCSFSVFSSQPGELELRLLVNDRIREEKIYKVDGIKGIFLSSIAKLNQGDSINIMARISHQDITLKRDNESYFTMEFLNRGDDKIIYGR